MQMLIIVALAVMVLCLLKHKGIVQAAPGEKVKRHWYLVLPGMLLLAAAFLCWCLAGWYLQTYGDLGFDSVLYTLTADLGGVDSNLIQSCLMYAVVRLPLLVVGWAVLNWGGSRVLLLHRKEKAVRLFPFSNKLSVSLSLLVSLALVLQAADYVGLIRYIADVFNPSTLFEEEYRYSDDAPVTFPEEKRNLIYIYMESMETTFFSKEEGGALEENVIPELYQLAEENLNFSHHDGVGGFYSPPGTTWTIGAIVGQTAGIPLKTPLGVDRNGYGTEGVFLPGPSSLMKILRDAGYNQSVVFGSNGYFGGRLTYYVTHGCYDVYDLITARRDGIVTPEYHNQCWGMEDFYLYDYAKEILGNMSQQEEPFALSMLTVDTHHVGGFWCAQCEEIYEERYENVYRCASKQLVEFIQWLQQQDFYENTTIVVVGDHPSMDSGYMTRNSVAPETRKVYNCIINAAAEPQQVKNRQMTTFDMFPTTLAAMGCTIEGERLGLGTNVFSGEPTLLEKMGEETFFSEVSRYSRYYVENFY